MLCLKDLPVLAEGMNRKVFQHPANDDWLVKVIRTETLDRRGVLHSKNKKPRWYKFGHRHGMYTSFLREIEEFITLKAHHSEPIPCIEQVISFTETDLGLGLVVEKLRGPEGGLAPTLYAQVKKHGFTPELRRKFEAYRDQLLAFNIVTSNANPHNIVHAFGGPHGDRLVLVDGLGEKAFIPVHTFSPFLNRRSNVRRWEKTVRRLEALDVSRGTGA